MRLAHEAAPDTARAAMEYYLVSYIFQGTNTPLIRVHLVSLCMLARIKNALKSLWAHAHHVFTLKQCFYKQQRHLALLGLETFQNFPSPTA